MSHKEQQLELIKVGKKQMHNNGVKHRNEKINK